MLINLSSKESSEKNVEYPSVRDVSNFVLLCICVCILREDYQEAETFLELLSKECFYYEIQRERLNILNEELTLFYKLVVRPTAPH